MEQRTTGFYSAFEDRYRGSRKLIKSRLHVYLAFIKPLKEIYEHCEAVDLGCGRGEWLELLGENEFNAVGVDLDEGMLEACRTRNLSAELGEAVSYLQTLQDASVAVVSGFHIAEHLLFSDLEILVKEALRVLQPGGLLILETPNPENISVGSNSFYLDPSHQRPLPSTLLSFLLEYVGFHRHKIVRLQESPELSIGEEINLLQVLTGVSPDYAVIAQKKSTPRHMAFFDVAFDKEYGIELAVLANQYHTQMLHKILRNQNSVENLAEKLADIYSSQSWKLTYPLRWGGAKLQNAGSKLIGINKKSASLLRRFLFFLSSSAQSHPGLLAFIHIFLDRVPFIKNRLDHFLAGGKKQSTFFHKWVCVSEAQKFSPVNLSSLPLRADQIYKKLKVAIAQQQKEKV